jgi:hypothetical protein
MSFFKNLSCPHCGANLNNFMDATVCPRCKNDLNAPPDPKAPKRQAERPADSVGAVHGIGVILIICGLLCALYFAFLYDTSVSAQSEGIDVPGYGRVGALDMIVHNLGLLQNRQTGVWGGIGLSILGGGLLLYRGRNS